MIDTYFGNDIAALKELGEAAALTGLKYALTGVIGKRTKFQQHETSQLVVLAKSAGQAVGIEGTKPKTLDLNDDTLLESISFTQSHSTTTKESTDLPAELAGVEAGDQPPLHPLDATILLLITETIKNTNPEDGITREQMMPYAERVLSHSTNWEVYTLGLLVRSRIEGSRARTVERSVLQLQVVVDQVITETTGTQTDGADTNKSIAPSFLPQPKEGESASIRERLLYIHQLPIPTWWELEAELASRWASNYLNLVPIKNGRRLLRKPQGCGAFSVISTRTRPTMRRLGESVITVMLEPRGHWDVIILQIRTSIRRPKRMVILCEFIHFMDKVGLHSDVVV
jgi:hypothetical protein